MGCTLTKRDGGRAALECLSCLLCLPDRLPVCLPVCLCVCSVACLVCMCVQIGGRDQHSTLAAQESG